MVGNFQVALFLPARITLKEKNPKQIHFWLVYIIIFLGQTPDTQR